jgi:hypothetical protein
MGNSFLTILFIGKVSFSNPVRQPLFVYNDCLNGGGDKAKAACQMLRQIFPITVTENDPLVEEGQLDEEEKNSPFKHFSLTIPMPGHPIQEKDEVYMNL